MSIRNSNAGAGPAVDREDLHRLKAVGSEALIPAGQMVIERGQYGAGLYVVLEGSVVVEAPERRRKVGRGSYVGERALLSPSGRRTARVRADTDVLLLAVERSAFERLAADDPGFRSRLAAAGA